MRLVFTIVFSSLTMVAATETSSVRLTITDGLGRDLREEVDIVVRLDPSEPGHSVVHTRSKLLELPYHELGTAYIVSVSQKGGLTIDRRVVITSPSTDVWIALPQPSLAGIDRHSVTGSVEGLPANVYDPWVRLLPLIQTNDLRDHGLSHDQPKFVFRNLPRGRYLLVVLGKVRRPNAVPSILGSREVDLTEPDSSAELVVRLNTN